MDTDLAGQVAGIAQGVVASGATSANGHGNVSIRVPGAAEMYFTAGPSLRNHPAAAVVRVGLDGTLLEGQLPPVQGAVAGMHTAIYADHPAVGCVVHTHSPYATAYAVAGRPIGCWIEALAMLGMQEGYPWSATGIREMPGCWAPCHWAGMCVLRTRHGHGSAVGAGVGASRAGVPGCGTCPAYGDGRGVDLT